MANDTIKIRGKEYGVRGPNRMNRKTFKTFVAVAAKAQAMEAGLIEEESSDTPWQMLALMVPKLPESVLDELEMEEVTDLMGSIGVFETPKDDEAITLGESGASTDS